MRVYTIQLDLFYGDWLTEKLGVTHLRTVPDEGSQDYKTCHQTLIKDPKHFAMATARNQWGKTTTDWARLRILCIKVTERSASPDSPGPLVTPVQTGLWPHHIRVFSVRLQFWHQGEWKHNCWVKEQPKLVLGLPFAIEHILAPEMDFYFLSVKKQTAAISEYVLTVEHGLVASWWFRCHLILLYSVSPHSPEPTRPGHKAWCSVSPTTTIRNVSTAWFTYFCCAALCILPLPTHLNHIFLCFEACPRWPAPAVIKQHTVPAPG